MTFRCVALHERVDLLDKCCDLLNTEWKRSHGVRSRFLEKSNHEFPCSLLMLDEEMLIGHARLSRIVSEEKSLLLTSVIIDPNRRGEGLGRKLLHLTEEYAKKRGFTYLCLSSESKELFYKKCGFYETSPVQQCSSNALQSKFEMLQKSADHATSTNEVDEKMPGAEDESKVHIIPPPPPLIKSHYQVSSNDEISKKCWLRKEI
ncbi:N-alpha-acetyltransferase 80-like [Clavelina lepadiformis]|uniref:N-acetyltransferase domain-containing protein n=1 Tax=Clavelina lepadiformis TaxID=159417 RepID=A0ABP0GNF7_CLALP